MIYLALIVLLGAGSLMAKNAYDIKQAKTSKEKFYFYDDLFKKHAQINGIPWQWLKAIAKQESDLGLDKRVLNGEVSYDGLSYGIMQIATGVGSEQEKKIKGNPTREELNNPETSISIAAKLVGYLYRKYKGDKNKVFLAYNQGEKNTDNGKDYTTKYAADGVSYKEKIKKHLAWIENKEKEYLA